jgi:hypothetical protein
MDDKKIERAIAAIEREMIASNRRKNPLPRFHGLPLMRPEATDGPEVKALLERRNSAVRSYNAVAGHMGRILQQAVNRNAPQVGPQDDLLGIVDEWLRFRAARSRSVFWVVDSVLHLLEIKMKRTYHGPNGIKDLEEQMAKLRGARKR